MQLHRKHASAWIAACHHSSLAAGSCAAIKNRTINVPVETGLGPSRSAASQHCDQLRCFILNRNAPFAKGASSSDIAGNHPTRAGEQLTRCELYTFGGKFRISYIFMKMNGGGRHHLIVNANCSSGLEPILRDPTFHQPRRVGGTSTQRSRVWRCTDFCKVIYRRRSGNLPQNGIHERSCRTLARRFHQFHTFKDCSARRHSGEETQLICSQSQSS